MKQQKASPKKGSQRSGRKGSPRPAARKTTASKAAARARKPVRPVSKAAAPATRRRSTGVERSAESEHGTMAEVVQIDPKPTGLVKLPSECLIGSLDGLRAQLVECVAIETPVSLDAAAVERIDTAALQLLAAFTRDRKAAGLAITWTAVSASLTDAASLLNLTSVLALDADEASVKVAA